MSLTALPDFALSPDEPLAHGFLARGLSRFRAAAEHVWRLPYGRNTARDDFRLVLPEGRGTCSTKHALLAALARAHGVPLALVLGIYEMQEGNTPGVGATLAAHGLASVPEAHCVLRTAEGVRVDLTRLGPEASEPVAFLLEERIAPEDIGAHKVARHRAFVAGWAASRGLDAEAVWRAREACIAALAQAPAR